MTIYALNASGNIKPTATISGSNTGLSAPLGVAVGAGNIFVINNSVNFGASVTIYPLNASGNATPTATISGSNTGLSAPFGVAVGAGNIFVVNQPSNSVIIYPLNATGNATPTASINCISGADGIAIRSASHFSVTVSGAFMVGRPALAAACTPFNLTVTALDSSNNTVTSYHGKVTFATTAHDYALPPNSMLTNGVGTFSATLNTPGIQTLTATDTMNPSITGTSSNISVSAGAAKRFSVTGPTWVTPGQQFSFTVTALDCSNNIATSYSGTARFKSGDIKAVFVPRASTLKNGVGTFSATLITPGVQAVNATDTVARAITGTLGIHVQ